MNWVRISQRKRAPFTFQALQIVAIRKLRHNQQQLPHSGTMRGLRETRIDIEVSTVNVPIQISGSLETSCTFVTCRLWIYFRTFLRICNEVNNEWNLILSKKISPMFWAPRHGVLFDPPITLVGRCIRATLEVGKRWNGIEKTMVSGKGWKILGNWWKLWKVMLNVIMLIRAYFLWNTSYSINEI